MLIAQANCKTKLFKNLKDRCFRILIDDWNCVRYRQERDALIRHKRLLQDIEEEGYDNTRDAEYYHYPQLDESESEEYQIAMFNSIFEQEHPSDHLIDFQSMMLASIESR